MGQLERWDSLPVGESGVAAGESLSVVVPCYNEEAVLGEAVARLSSVCGAIFGQALEIILVDDGSQDSTWRLIQEAVEDDPHVLGVRLSKNHGHQMALLAGLSRIRGTLVLVIDADLQDPPELLQDMLEKLFADEADVVYGKRIRRAGERFLKRATASLFYRLLDTVTDVRIPMDTGDFRLMRRHIADLLVDMPERDRFTRGMVSWLGFKQVPYEYERAERFAGSTKYTPRKMFQLASDAFLGFSLLPLRVGIFLSVLTLLFSIAVISYSIWSWLAYDTVEGWTSVMVFMSVVASAQFAVLGVMGEYIGRIYLQDKRRPLFIVRETCSSDPVSTAKQADH